MSQNRLEKEAFLKREEYDAKNIYDRKGESYSSQHKNALSDGDEKGKGTGSGGHTYSVPGMSTSKTQIKKEIDTEKGGSSVDISKRSELEVINKYNKYNYYSSESVDTSANVMDGQIVIK